MASSRIATTAEWPLQRDRAVSRFAYCAQYWSWLEVYDPDIVYSSLDKQTSVAVAGSFVQCHKPAQHAVRGTDCLAARIDVRG
jgi:hypothetical protein